MLLLFSLTILDFRLMNLAIAGERQIIAIKSCHLFKLAQFMILRTIKNRGVGLFEKFSRLQKVFLVTIRTLGLFETKLVGHPARNLFMFKEVLVFVAAHVHLIKSALDAERKDTTRLTLNDLSHFGICGQCRRHA